MEIVYIKCHPLYFITKSEHHISETTPPPDRKKFQNICISAQQIYIIKIGNANDANDFQRNQNRSMSIILISNHMENLIN